MNIRVLIVSSNELILRRVKAVVLEELGESVELDTVCDPEAALECLADGNIDILLTDLDMPPAVGIALLNHAHADNKLTRTIVLAGGGDYDWLLAAISAGAMDVVMKPIDSNTLAERIRETAKWVERTKVVKEFRQRQARLADASVVPSTVRCELRPAPIHS